MLYIVYIDSRHRPAAISDIMSALQSSKTPLNERRYRQYCNSYCTKIPGHEGNCNTDKNQCLTPNCTYETHHTGPHSCDEPSGKRLRRLPGVYREISIGDD